MKLFSIFISFALVGYIFSTKLDDYIKQVILINDEIEKAREFMPTIIKNLMLKDNDYGSEDIAYMLAVPDRIDVKLQGHNFDSDDETTEDILEVAEILASMKELVLDEIQIPFENLALGEDINQDQVPVINLDPEEDTNPDPSTVPEEVSTSENQNLVGITIKHLEEKLQYQKNLRLEILAFKDRPKYEKRIESARKTKTENIATVLEVRRINPTAVSSKKFLCRFGLDYLAASRREITLKAITSLIRQNDPVFQDLYKMCCLAAAFRSIKYPRSFIIAVDILEDNRCCLTDVTEEQGYVYTFFGDEFWEVDLDSNDKIRLFLSELE